MRTSSLFPRQSSYICSLRVLALVVVLVQTGRACSPIFAPMIETPVAGEVLPSDTIFRCRYYPGDVVKMVLTDEKGQVVPAKQHLSSVPSFTPFDAPYFCQLQPLQPLAAGTYELEAQSVRRFSRKQKFVIGSEADTQAPQAMGKLRVEVTMDQVPDGINADCSSNEQERMTVVVRAKATHSKSQPLEPVENSLIYELAWAPVVNGVVDLAQEDSLTGIRPYLSPKMRKRNDQSPEELKFFLPLEEFRALKESDKQLRFQLFAVDRSGNCSIPAEAMLNHRSIRKLIKALQEQEKLAEAAKKK
jgi:hypothetical protein